MVIEKKYIKLSDIEHVLLRPARYVGSTKEHTAHTWVIVNGNMIFHEITWNPALIKLFDEIISNSVDDSKRPDSTLDTIKVTIENLTGRIIVEDNGGIPVVIHKEHKQYVPEMIFSELRAGSNFDDSDQAMLTGQNGEGASLVNVLSTEFTVVTSDGKKQFSQTFTNNMQSRTKPRIVASVNNFTKISYIPDYKRLETTLSVGNVAKLTKRVYDIAGCNPKLKIFLNGKRIKIRSFKDYIKLYTEDYIYDDNLHWRVGFSSSDSGFRHVSYVNGTETTLGGSHIDYIVNQVVNEVRLHIEKKYKMKIRPSDIKNHMMLFVDCNVVNPRYSSQTKEELITEIRDFKTSYEVSKLLIEKILKSEIIQGVLDWVAAKAAAADRAALRKKQRSLSKKRVASHIPASSKKRDDCILFITEGLSAISNLVNVRNPNIHGGIPLKGKPKNTYGMKPTEIVKNEELSNIMAVIGLELGNPAKNLNYGKIAIMADQDYDGLNIRALLVNFFSNWKELFEEERVVVLQTPIVIARKGKNIKRYYSMKEYMKDSSELKSWTIEYLKGLGSLSIDEYDKAINEPKFDVISMDDNWSASLDLAFGKNTQLRKDWLLEAT